MDLVERYLQAVRFWLPRENQDDILAELAEDLRCQQEEAEARLGRPLDAGETADLVRRTGHPLQVAARFAPARPLLAPGLDRVHRFVLKVVLLWIMVPLLLVVALPTALLSEHPLAATGGALVSFAFSEVMALGFITLVFYLVGAAGVRPDGTWDPRRLPPLRAPKGARPVPKATSIFEAVFSLLFAAWWLEASTGIPMGWSSRLGPLWSAGPLWQDFHARWFIPVLVLALGNSLAGLATLARPHWVRFRLAYSAVSSGLSAGMCLLTVAANRASISVQLHGLRNLETGLRDAASRAGVLDAMVALVLLVVGLACLLAALVHTARFALSFGSASPRPR